MKRWYTSDESPIPTQVECDPVGFPHKDEHGRKQFNNTHFDDESSDWEQGRATVEAFVSLSGAAVAQAEKALEKARAEAGESAKMFHAFMLAYRHRPGELPL